MNDEIAMRITEDKNLVFKCNKIVDFSKINKA